MPRAYRGLALCAAVGVWLLAMPRPGMPGPANASEAAASAQAERKCPVPAEAQWSAAETFVWNRVCAGEEADFSKSGGYLDPQKPDRWGQDRVIGAGFLRTILGDRYRHALTPLGVSIVNARFTEKIDLRNAELTRELSLRSSRLEAGADLSGLSSTHSIMLDYSVADRPVVMYNLHLAGNLSAFASTFSSLSLRGANIEGWVRFVGAKLDELLDMNGIRIRSELFMRSEGPGLRAEFGAVDLVNARVGQVDLKGAKVKGRLDMDGIAVGRHVHLEMDSDDRIKPEFSDIVLDAAQIGGALVLIDAAVAGEFDCRLIEVSQVVFLFDTTFGGTLNCQWARVKGDFRRLYT